MAKQTMHVNANDVNVIVQAMNYITSAQRQIGNVLSNFDERIMALEDPESNAASTTDIVLSETIPSSDSKPADLLYIGAAEVLSTREIDRRIDRLCFILQEPQSKKLYFEWRSILLDEIGTVLHRLKYDAVNYCKQHNMPNVIKSIYDAVDAVPEYKEKATVAMYKLERKAKLFFLRVVRKCLIVPQ